MMIATRPRACERATAVPFSCILERERIGEPCPGYMEYPFVQLLVVAFTPFTLIPEKRCSNREKISRHQNHEEASCGRCLLYSATCSFG